MQSVCDKAQELVNQTKDDTLNTYLESIKTLYEKIVTKSKVLTLTFVIIKIVWTKYIFLCIGVDGVVRVFGSKSFRI